MPINGSKGGGHPNECSQGQVEARFARSGGGPHGRIGAGGDGDRSQHCDRRSRSRSCPTVRARSARSTTRTWQVSSPRWRSSPARKAKNPNKPRDGWTGGSINGHPLKLVGVGCSNDRADTAIKETKRLMEQLGADIMIGPLSGDESIAVANYAKQHPYEDVRRRCRRRAGHDAEGAGAELLPLQRRRCDVERRPRGPRLQQAGLEDGGGRCRRLQLRAGRPQPASSPSSARWAAGHEAGLPAAQHDRLLVVRTAAADQRRRHVRRGRWGGARSRS